ncbi:molybdopterin-guanine dinucleotide biosynthesis protein B [Candidatus Marsarchaeota G1 archaeon OSP_D]|uniref:Molybdopterin-guanine dinucleotide biosynthesis protein B n=3 Tax=Candidatus Marsarchaeota group 1 TaxID=2203770 RepID=A0A2R6AFF1_9ARCH|nr:MAG: molybdopterin-guanine dinucleotide biosynthesis protein B [Candidatus Marsarchaeota G1 archaeon OSP_D]PSN85117.1 MAG: molybdopterin-guanine dinucleotide biosynthesis protein B [Candidatus Marsarchaeota G1 archaeon BE_D]PSN88317.1 MAG: molybdopterin-guanine dinucleotide biosynthesis protein B [Candidatus Marsarchaeota G1 archaeon OSP_C]
MLLIAVHFLGYKNSGKTTTIQQLTSHFVAHGKRVGVLKHIHKEKLELSARFKDTQRFLDAGAQTVCALSRNELVFYLRERTLDDALELLKSFPLDFLFIEGYSTNERFFGIKCVVCAKSVDEAISLIDIHRQRKILAVTGALRSKTNDIKGIPVLKLPRDLERLAQLVAS